MESRKPNGVFELTERRLNTPAGSIEVLESRRRELAGIKVCKDGFKGGVGDRETDNAQMQGIKRVWDHVSGDARGGSQTQ